jgi:hypothetical protein
VNMGQSSKKIFLGLTVVSYFILVLICLGAWYLIEPRLLQVSLFLPTVVLAAAVLFLAGAGIAVGLIMITAITEKDVLVLKRLKPLTISLFFPIIMVVGRLLGFSKQRIRQSFISVNNAMVKAGKKNITSKRLLILLPQCLQNLECDRRITTDIDHCIGCGKCSVGAIRKIGAACDATIAVATGGTLARRVIVDTQPSVILAVACDRDLTSGIQYAHRIPTLGVLNRHPQGPCMNTQVDLVALEEELEFITRGRDTRRLSSVAPAYPVTARSES